MANQKRVFIAHNIPDTGPKLLREAGLEVAIWPHDHVISQDKLLKEAKKSNALVSMLFNQIDEPFLKEASHLEIVSNFAVGYNNIDVLSAKSFGIKVGNTPGVLTEATANLALTLLLSVGRNISPSISFINEGKWNKWEPMGFLGFSPEGKTLGIFGMGRIGYSFAKKCKHALGMKVIFTSRSPKKEIAKELEANQVSLEELLAESDVLSIHSDLNPTTKGLFNKNLFCKMKKRPILINTSRGEIHNEEDILWALENQVLGGAGLDVTNPEPTSAQNPLLAHPRCLITPHIGSATHEAREKMSEISCLNVLNAFQGNPLPGPVSD